MTETVLDNGVRIITLPVAAAKVSAIIVAMKAGSRHESGHMFGAAHLLEHMVFKGTQNRRSAEVLRSFDALGGSSNAFTERDMTYYVVKTVPEDLPAAAYLLFDLVHNAIIPEDELIPEKGVVIEEINRENDDPLADNLEILGESIFAGSDLSHRILGSEESVKAVSAGELRAFRNRYYVGSNAAVFVGGVVPGGLVDHYLRPLFSQLAVSPPSIITSCNFASTAFRTVKAQSTADSQLQLALGFPLLTHNSRQQLMLNLATALLCDAWSSRLKAEIRERLGLAYSIEIQDEIFEDCGLLSVLSGIDGDRGPQALNAILRVLKDAKSDVTDAELQFYKDLVCRRLQFNSDNVESYINNCMQLYMQGFEILTLEQEIEHIQSIRLADFLHYLGIVFDFDRAILSLLGPNAEDSGYRSMIESFN